LRGAVVREGIEVAVVMVVVDEFLRLRLLCLLHLRRGRVGRGRVVRGYRGGVDGLAVGVLARDEADATLLVRVLLLDLAQELLDDLAQRTALVRDVLAKPLVGVLEILVSPGSPSQYVGCISASKASESTHQIPTSLSFLAN